MEIQVIRFQIEEDKKESESCIINVKSGVFSYASSTFNSNKVKKIKLNEIELNQTQ